MFSFVLLVAVADAFAFVSPADGPCCKECKLPEKKYYSVDHGFGHKPFCGEACIDPAKYKEYHLFEKNLTAANNSDACARQLTQNDYFYNVYTKTETHGVPGILTVTLDLYAPGSCAATEYCCPDAKHCLTATNVSCAQDATVCSDKQACCPLTKLCVDVGAECVTPCAEDSYCCPDARHCLTPVKPGTLCTGAGTQGSCSHGEVCCPVTNECVRVGPECTPP